MTEPTYIYVRGEGWVVAPQHIAKLKDLNVRIEIRKPNLGERFFWGWGVEHMKDNIEHIGKFNYGAFPVWGAREENYLFAG